MLPLCSTNQKETYCKHLDHPSGLASKNIVYTKADTTSITLPGLQSIHLSPILSTKKRHATFSTSVLQQSSSQ